MDRYLGGCWVMLGSVAMAWAQGPAVSQVTVQVDLPQRPAVAPQVRLQRDLVVPERNLMTAEPVSKEASVNIQALRQAHPFVVPPRGFSVPLSTVPYRYEAPQSTWIPREYDGLRFYLIPLKEEPKLPMLGPAQTR